MFVCVCNAVTDSDIRKAVNEGVRNLNQLKRTTGCGSKCGTCKDEAVEVLQHALVEKRESLGFIPILQAG